MHQIDIGLGTILGTIQAQEWNKINTRFGTRFAQNLHNITTRLDTTMVQYRAKD